MRVRACSPLVQPTRWGDTRARAAIQKSVRFPPSRAPTSSPSVAAPTPCGGGRRAEHVRRQSPRPAKGQASPGSSACHRSPSESLLQEPTNQRVENIWGFWDLTTRATNYWQRAPHLSTDYYFTLEKRTIQRKQYKPHCMQKKHRRTHTSCYSPNQSPN